MITDAFSSYRRPVLHGRLGAVAAAHPLAVSAGQEMLAAGGSAADALIAAQAVLSVIAPDACGLGGDLFCLLRAPDSDQCVAVNAAGAAPRALQAAAADGALSATVPGLVLGWEHLASRWGRLGLARALAPAIRIASDGFTLGASLVRTVETQRARLTRGGAQLWPLFEAGPGSLLRQPALAETLGRIAGGGAAAFYDGAVAAAIVGAVTRLGGVMELDDLASHRTVIKPPLMLRWRGLDVMVQPPMSQGILLLMALAAEAKLGSVPDALIEHVGIELTEAAFAYRQHVVEGTALLEHDLAIDLERAGRRGGPRAYLHTAGVAVADRSGMVISSLVSVFDDFGSCVYVPEGGFMLNNRAGGFTTAPNDAAPGKLPVHTLAPIMVRSEQGWFGLATPGADGQVQVLLQLLVGLFSQRLDLSTVIARPRWRSEAGQVLIERGHPAIAGLEARGHALKPLPDGDLRFGAVVAAGIDGQRQPFAVSDWRRETWSGVC